MANQLAIALHTRPGDTVLTEQDSHCYLFEAGAGAALSGIQFDLLPREVGLSDAAIMGALKREGLHNATTTLLVVENTHNVGAGRVLPAHEMQRIAGTAKRHGLAVHCDGARLWNAAAAAGSSEAALVAGFDSVAVCFSKGLGAPVGSALAGPRGLIERARKLRKRWGGGMRQAGYLAAAALFALENHRARLADDHRLAHQIAETLRGLGTDGALEVRYPEPGTNLLYFKLAGGTADAHLRHIADQGVLVSQIAGNWLRAVTHLDVGSTDAERLVSAVTKLLRLGTY
jgi:threonine aldolase